MNFTHSKQKRVECDPKKEEEGEVVNDVITTKMLVPSQFTAHLII